MARTLLAALVVTALGVAAQEPGAPAPSEAERQATLLADLQRLVARSEADPAGAMAKLEQIADWHGFTRVDWMPGKLWLALGDRHLLYWPPGFGAWTISHSVDVVDLSALSAPAHLRIERQPFVGVLTASGFSAAVPDGDPEGVLFLVGLHRNSIAYLDWSRRTWASQAVSGAHEPSPYHELLEAALEAPVVAVGRVLEMRIPWLSPTRREAELAIERLVKGLWDTAWRVDWPAGAPGGREDAPLLLLAWPPRDGSRWVDVRVRSTDGLSPNDARTFWRRVDALADVLAETRIDQRDRRAVDWLVEQCTDELARPGALKTLATFVTLGPEGGFGSPLATQLTAEQVDLLVGVLCEHDLSPWQASWLCAALEHVSAVHPRIAEGVLRQLAARGRLADWEIVDPLVLLLGHNTQGPALRDLVNRIRWTGPDPSGAEPQGSLQERERLLDELVAAGASASEEP